MIVIDCDMTTLHDYFSWYLAFLPAEDIITFSDIDKHDIFQIW